VDFSGAYLVRLQIMYENYLFEFRTQNLWCSLVYWLWWVT
jgi:hypothetical protein